MVWYKSPTSVLGKDGNDNDAWFADGGTIAFVQQFSRNLRYELVGANIRVSLLEPGMVGA